MRMTYEDYIFCKNYSDCIIGKTNKNMDHIRFNMLKSIYESLSPKEKLKIMKSYE
jgi:hypothetical protein